MIPLIGKWAVRVLDWDGGRSMHGKAHLVESEIAERLVLRCGRELPRRTKKGTFEEFVARRLDARCMICQWKRAS